MARTKKELKDNLRLKYMEAVKDALTQMGEDVLMVASNKMALPVVDEDGNEYFVELTVKIPNGSRDGTPYDGYELAEEYEGKQRMKAEKLAEKKAKLAKKKEEE